MEVGLGPRELITGRDHEVVLQARLQVLVVDGETSTRQASGVVYEEMGTEEPPAAAASSEPRRNATERTALAVAATAAVVLTNLFFLLHGRGDAELRCCCCCWIEGISMLFALAAFLSAAGLVLVRHAARHGTIASAARRRVLLVASAAALFVAAAGTVLSLLNAQGGLPMPPWRGTPGPPG
ncbi:unnamed protein product [Urochloa humidicola]